MNEASSLVPLAYYSVLNACNNGIRDVRLGNENRENFVWCIVCLVCVSLTASREKKNEEPRSMCCCTLNSIAI